MPMKSIASILNSESSDEAEILLQIATLPEQQQPGQKIKLPSIKELLNQQPPAIYTPPASRSPSLPHTLPYQFPADRSPSGPTSAIHGIQSKESRFLPYSHRRANSANESPSFKSSPIMRPSSTEDVTAVKKEPYYYSYNPQVIQKAKKNEDSKRFDLLPNGTIAERHCGDCGNNRTSGHWCQDSLVVGGYICQKCYRRRRRDDAQDVITPIPKRVCHSCQAPSTNQVWFKHFALPGEYICFTCNENLHPSVKTKFKKCDGCGSVKTTKWATDVLGNLMCRKCTATSSATSKVGFPGQGSISASPTPSSEMEE